MNFSGHFKRTMALVALLVIFLASGFLWLRHKIHDVFVPPQVLLPAKDKAIVSYDEHRHVVTVTTPTGTAREYGRNPTVEVRKDGTVKVNAHKWGMELRPYLGVGYSDAW